MAKQNKNILTAFYLRNATAVYSGLAIVIILNIFTPLDIFNLPRPGKPESAPSFYR
jgi:hypothetical protein